MSLPRFSVENRVLVNMLMVVVLVAGAMFAFTLTREMFPESRPNKIAVTTIYPGVQPQEIEKSVTIKIEEAVRDIDGIEKVDSAVSEGLSMTVLTLLSEVEDVEALLQEVKTEVDAIQDLPEGVETTTVRKMEPRLPVISVALYGAGDEASLKRAANRLRDDLLRLPGISDVQISGVRDDEISVEVRPERLLEYNISFNEVADAVRQSNLDVSGGQLKGERANVAVRTLGEENRGVDLEDIVVRTRPNGTKVYLSDVALIRDDFVETDLESWFNGYPAVHCIIYKNGDQDAIQISTLVKAYVKGKLREPFDPYGFEAAAQQPWYWRPYSLVEAGVVKLARILSGRPDPEAVYEESRGNPFPHNFQVALHTDLARFIEGRLDLMLRDGKQGIVLVLISLVLFLNWRVAFWVGTGIPIAFLGTFAMMWLLGATLNLMSLFGLIIVSGILVDDAIVIGENVYRHIQNGVPPKQAAVIAAEEVMWPVTAAVLTNIAAFLPLLFVKGQVGDFMKELPLVVIAALTVSLLETLMMFPAHLAELPSKQEMDARAARRPSRGKRLRRITDPLGRITERLSHGRVMAAYQQFLRTTLRWRYVTVATALTALFLSVGLLASGIVPWVFVQKMDSETLVAALEMPVGTPADLVRDRLQALTARAVELPEVKNVQMYVALQVDITGAGAMGGNMQSHLGQLIIELQPADERELKHQRSSEDVLTELRKVSESLTGVNSIVWESLNGGPGGRDIEIRVSGPRFEVLEQVATDLKQELANFQGVYDLDDDTDRGKREVQLRLREAARPTGITVGMLGDHVRSALYGKEAMRLTRNREDVRVMVRYPESFRRNVYNVESMWIPTAASSAARGWVPLGEVAELTEAASFSTIRRSEQQRAVRVLGDVQEGVSVNDVLSQVRGYFDQQIRPQHPDVHIEFLGSFEEQSKAIGSLLFAMPIALLLIFMLLAGVFQSYWQPLVVMSAIPFGIMGAILGHWITGYPLTILSAIGLIALTGIVVNDSIVLVDFVNARLRRGLSPMDACVEGASLRLRAIFLTSSTTVLGILPLMFETSFQAKFLIPMAVTLAFGLACSTTLTLVIVPALNLIYYDLIHALGLRKSEVEEPVVSAAS